MTEVKELEKVTLRLYRGDIERVRSAAPKVGASFVIRNLVASWLEKVESQVPAPVLNVELDDILDKVTTND